MFDRSNIPMALIDRERRYVAVNDAALALYQRPREQIIGTLASSGMTGADPSAGEATWEGLVQAGELYGDEVVRLSDEPIRVSYAAHATHVDGRWLALFVVLSAQPESDGHDLISAVTPAPEGSARSGGGGASPAKRLTPREREVVQRVALGRSTPQIAVDLNLSPATVRSHVRNAMVKAGAHTRAQLVALVLSERLAGE